MLENFQIRMSKAHAKLQSLAQSDGQARVQDLFNRDEGRFQKMHVESDGFLFDYSKHRVTDEVFTSLLELASEANWQNGRSALFSGQPINQTEKRAVMHMAMRADLDDGFEVHDKNVMPVVIATRRLMLEFADRVRENPQITDVVNIGIGGSDLGPLMVTKALRSFAEKGPRVHFVSNVDGAHLHATLGQLTPSSTLFVVVSKTFTTQETMTNAQAAKDWLVNELGEEGVNDHFAAVSTNLPAANAFGIASDSVFGFDDWVGGRYSLWGPVGLSIACAIGSSAFQDLLSGARAMDRHFQDAPDQQNMPLISALLGIWYVEYLGLPSHVILPYAQDLDRFPAYLQQADMESNGKSMGRDGKRVSHHTGPVVWGEAGTNGQHAFYQLLHQGTTVHPADIIAVKESLSPFEGHHEKLLANAIAQAEALMVGKSEREVREEMKQKGMNPAEIDAIAPHRVFEGNRPTSFILLEKLDPRRLGMLIAFYEHRIFVQGLLWNVCSFDQWGVELGKVLANQILVEWNQGSELKSAESNHDSSTQYLMNRVRRVH